MNLSEYQRPQLPPRPADGHKGTFGRVALIGGSHGMSGAVTLSSVAALRSGSGLVTAVVPASIQGIVAAFEPSIMTFGLKCDAEGQLSSPFETQLTSFLKVWDTIGIGPGLGRSQSASELVRWVLESFEGHVLLDADALFHYSLLDHTSRSCTTHSVVMTPHPGEFARLVGQSVTAIESDRVKWAAGYASEHRAVIVLKGHRTIVTDGVTVYINTSGNSGMATGGSGDVLTGMITSLLGQGMSAMDAAVLGVFAHGTAGDIAARDLTERGMIASDLLKYLPAAWRECGTSI
ncbi:MAG: NAD(P)H-hydrate dehydratase [Planctomyces sp.]|nr:NAD(P)H-hydrate dehydratase [Planctomyces sp.]